MTMPTWQPSVSPVLRCLHQWQRKANSLTHRLAWMLWPFNMQSCLFQTALLMVAVFLLSWLPHFITMWAEFGQFPLNDFTFRIISHCLAYGNSCINPIVYAFLSESFRKACRQAFTRKSFLRPVATEPLARIRMENLSSTHSTTNL